MSNTTVTPASTGAVALNTGDTAWMLLSTSMVFFMTPGLALFYGGLVRSKHSINLIGQNIVALGVMTIQWFMWGYSLSFSGGSYIMGTLTKMFFARTDLATGHELAPTVPEQLFAMYQMMFCIITPALITGATADRFKFKSYIIFIFAWGTLVYDPICHMIWSKAGWLYQMGILDFAGGLVVHVAAATAALVCCLMLGKRQQLNGEQFIAHSPVLVVIGTGLLWFGWFGFNAGSAESSGTIAVSAYTATHLAAAFAGMTWIGLEVCFNEQGKPTVIGLCTGFVAGLATITPAAGFVEPLPAMAIGVVGAVVGFSALKFREHTDYSDDALDVFAVHGCGSASGVLLTGIFANHNLPNYGAPTGTFSIDDKTNDLAGGWLNHNYRQLGVQLLGLVVVMAWSAIFTYIIMAFLRMTVGIRVSAEEEQTGLDFVVHGEFRSEHDHPDWAHTSTHRGHVLKGAAAAAAAAAPSSPASSNGVGLASHPHPRIRNAASSSNLYHGSAPRAPAVMPARPVYGARAAESSIAVTATTESTSSAFESAMGSFKPWPAAGAASDVPATVTIEMSAQK